MVFNLGYKEVVDLAAISHYKQVNPTGPWTAKETTLLLCPHLTKEMTDYARICGDDHMLMCGDCWDAHRHPKAYFLNGVPSIAEHIKQMEENRCIVYVLINEKVIRVYTDAACTLSVFWKNCRKHITRGLIPKGRYKIYDPTLQLLKWDYIFPGYAYVLAEV